MTKLFVTILIVFSSAVFAQKVEKLFNEEKFKELTGLENESPSFTGEELYYLGFAFFREENDDKAIEYYNKALKKGFDNALVYYHIGLSQMYQKKYDEALKNINTGLESDPLAEFYYEKLRIYSIREDAVNQEKTFLEALQKSRQKDNWYVKIVLFAGGFYYTQKEYAKSEKIYKEALTSLPKEYELYTKLIKSLNVQNKFSEADSYFEKMRTFYENKELPEDEMKFKNLNVDQFDWKNQVVNIHKYFEKPKEMLQPLYVLYLINEKGDKVERKFKIEKTVQIEKTDPQFVICEETKSGHSTYPIGFKDASFTLEDLRKEITDVLNNKYRVAASFEHN
ncbi:tetratricopeptide repeat protein [Chryseobacterium gambrini]|uniref:Tetratricopeptide repeat protein n=1 Tax=Chryseobacterium gambrini TaxID=373672 RepID=A0AAJ1R5Z2_9FLAO|nr:MULTISPECIES: tetratricopeptide repeat protein [Chryseobacterium]MDN4012233.1 tetratricopeptide repeat protein [Chryseobacterium gambrini]MDN4031451.1 tetratricopeptide repeat protein [Chryseobacterium gambrini]QWA36894.1 tetratricopeptide repeat protein [Chryseobacterium sp. ZHDP1]